MRREKCSFCGKKAFAFRLEADGSRIYLCITHLPEREEPAQALVEKWEDRPAAKPAEPGE
jgi:hypothetical protein